MEKMFGGLFAKFFKAVNPDASEQEIAYYWKEFRQEIWRSLIADEQLFEAYIALCLTVRVISNKVYRMKTFLNGILAG